MKRTLIALFSLLLTSTAFAQLAPSITPNIGSTAGGEEVIIKGDFGTWPPSVRFGLISAPVAERLDPTTLRVITPPHLPGVVEITLFDYDMWISTGLHFEFVDGYPEAAYERVLLPILTPPVTGGYGSDFRSALSLMNRTDDEYLVLYGLFEECLFLCPEPVIPSIELAPMEELGDAVVNTGNPGRFIYLPREDRNDFVLQLRAYDISREPSNYGTEIPVVRDDEMRREPVTLLGVPTDPRFRSTLRIYAIDERAFDIRIEGENGFVRESTVYAPSGANLFDPAYALFTDFPTGVGPVRVTITALEPIVTPPAIPTRFWAFISVTNNDTQHITVVSPQR